MVSEDIVYSDFAEQLHIEGINFKGYGIIPKFVMTDANLPLTSKSIYAFLCSFTGSGNTAFPGRDRILSALKINKDSYYKYLNLLIDAGYVTVKQLHNKGGQGIGFSNNLYTLTSDLAKIKTLSSDTKDYSLLRTEGIKAFGYGFIAKAAVTDERLDVKAKGLYAYLCSFLGGGETAFPKKDDILYHLSISHNTYNRLIKELVTYNYIEVRQRVVGGSFSVNDYVIIDKPNVSSVTGEKGWSYIDSPCTKFSDTQNPDTQISDTQNPDTIINNPKINKIKKEQSINQSGSTPSTSKKERGKEEILFELNNSLEIPKNYLSNKQEIKKAIDLLCSFEGHEDFYKSLDGFDRDFPELFKAALISMLSETKTAEYEGNPVTPEDVRVGVSRYVEKDYLTGNPSIKPLLFITRDLYKKAAEISEPRFPIAFCKRIIWNAIIQGSI